MSNLPFVNVEDKPPNLRFQQTALPDKIATEQAGGKPQYMDAIVVYARAAGDSKCETKDIAEKVGYNATTKTVTVEKNVVKYRQGEGGDLEEYTERMSVPEDKVFYEKKIVHPWLDKLRGRHKNGQISDGYLEYCENAFKRFKENASMPVDGTPLADWMGAPESVKKRAIEIGINSVEKAADMTEEALQSIGMGARAMKDKAKAYLEADRNSEEFASRMVDLESQNREYAEQMSMMERKIEELQGMQKDEADIDNLRAQYEEAFGEAPDKRWGAARIKDALKEKESEAA